LLHEMKKMKKDVDARDKRGHDAEDVVMRSQTR
jgi:hypothetical protein